MADKFKGFPYPITKDARGYFHTSDDVDQIKSDLLILLLTNPSERIMLPSFGAGLRDLIFEPNDLGLHAKARELIINAISAWEPRISVEQVDVLSSVDDSSLDTTDDLSESESILMIRIRFFDPQNIKSVQELNLQVPLGGGV